MADIQTDEKDINRRLEAWQARKKEGQQEVREYVSCDQMQLMLLGIYVFHSPGFIFFNQTCNY